MLQSVTIAGVSVAVQVTDLGNGSYSFIMPAEDVTITASTGDLVLTADGKDFASLDSFVSYVNAQSTSKDYTITLNHNLTVPASFDFTQITKANSLTFEGSDKTITFEGTKLTIPYNVTFNVEIEASTTVDFNVNAGVTLILGAAQWENNVPYINNITGTSTSKLFINNTRVTRVNNISNFASVDGRTLFVHGNVSNVTKFSGPMVLCGENSVASIQNVAVGSIITLFKNSKGNISKLTINDVISAVGVSKFTIAVQKDYIGSQVTVESGTTLLYTNGKDLSEYITIENKTSDNKELTAYYYSSTKSIKAEDGSAITVTGNGETKNFPNLELVCSYINNYKAADGNTTAYDYTITLNKPITAPTNFTFPTKNVNSLEIKGAAITFTGTTLNIPYDVTFSSELKVDNATDTINITVANGKTLNIAHSFLNDKGKPYINSISGGNNSVLYLDDDDVSNGLWGVCVNTVSGFGEVKTTSDYGMLRVYGNSTIAKFDGNIAVYGEKTNVTINKFVTGSSIDLAKYDNCKVSTVTINDVEVTSVDTIYLCAIDPNTSRNVDFDFGTTVLKTNGKDFSDKIVFTIDFDKKLTAYYYSSTKQIKAEDGTALTLKSSVDGGANWSEIGNYPNFDLLLEYINSQTYKTGEKIPAYQISVNKDVTVPANFALPTTAKVSGIKFTGNSLLTFKGTSLNIPYDVTIGCHIDAENNNSDMLNVTVANNATLTISKRITCFGRITGNANTSKIVADCDIVCTTLSGFKNVTGYIYLGGTMSNIGEFNGHLDVRVKIPLLTLQISAIIHHSLSIKTPREQSRE